MYANPTTPQPDATRDFAAALADPSRWVIKTGVPVFKPHERTDPNTGKLIRVDVAKLHEIAANMQRLERDAGVPVRITLGHTQPQAPEVAQPPICGYYRNARVGTFGPRNEPAVIADEWLDPQYGGVRKNYPYRSSEYYDDTKQITGVALLTRDPYLDLGVVAYSRTAPCATHYSRAGAPAPYLFTFGDDEMPQPTYPQHQYPAAGTPAYPTYGPPVGATHYTNHQPPAAAPQYPTPAPAPTYFGRPVATPQPEPAIGYAYPQPPAAYAAPVGIPDGYATRANIGHQHQSGGAVYAAQPGPNGTRGFNRTPARRPAAQPAPYGVIPGWSRDDEMALRRQEADDADRQFGRGRYTTEGGDPDRPSRRDARDSGNYVPRSERSDYDDDEPFGMPGAMGAPPGMGPDMGGGIPGVPSAPGPGGPMGESDLRQLHHHLEMAVEALAGMMGPGAAGGGAPTSPFPAEDDAMFGGDPSADGGLNPDLAGDLSGFDDDADTPYRGRTVPTGYAPPQRVPQRRPQAGYAHNGPPASYAPPTASGPWRSVQPDGLNRGHHRRLEGTAGQIHRPGRTHDAAVPRPKLAAGDRVVGAPRPGSSYAYASPQPATLYSTEGATVPRTPAAPPARAAGSVQLNRVVYELDQLRRANELLMYERDQADTDGCVAEISRLAAMGYQVDDYEIHELKRRPRAERAAYLDAIMTRYQRVPADGGIPHMGGDPTPAPAEMGGPAPRLTQEQMETALRYESQGVPYHQAIEYARVGVAPTMYGGGQPTAYGPPHPQTPVGYAAPGHAWDGGYPAPQAPAQPVYGYPEPYPTGGAFADPYGG